MATRPISVDTHVKATPNQLKALRDLIVAGNVARVFGL
jgi:hypothetical protein